MSEPKVRRVASNPQLGPFCEARVNCQKLSNSEIASRQRRTQARGMSFNQCSAPVSHEINGTKLCARHAGDVCTKYFEQLQCR
jgi:hypothetical protein